MSGASSRSRRLRGALSLLLNDPVAHRLLVGTAAAVVAGEVGATIAGRIRDARSGGSGAVVRQDGGTRVIVVAAIYAAIAGSYALARVPALRAGANTWWTLGLGVAVTLAGIALRAWAIVSLGRYFRRSVSIETGQRIVRRGPYRLLRHPSYAGLILMFGGFGLAFGSWVSAVVALLVVLAGVVPRIRVEEKALARAFGAEYADYASTTARLLPLVW